jgi:hypothetical protein
MEDDVMARVTAAVQEHWPRARPSDCQTTDKGSCGRFIRTHAADPDRVVVGDFPWRAPWWRLPGRTVCVPRR